ncbi:MAG: ABC transporter permease [Gaiellaceae bacterium]
MTSLRIFFVGGLTSYRALFGFMSPWIFIPTLVLTPLFQILLFVYIGRTAELESDEFYVIGNALQYASVPCLFAMTNTIAGERYQQTLGFVLVTPAGRLPLFLGRSLPVILNGAFVAAFSLAVSGLMLGIDVPAAALGPLALVVFVSALSCTGLGLVLAGIGLRVRETSVLLNIIFGFLLVFTGANVPLDDLPAWMRAVSEGVPLTHGIEAARRLADGSGLADVRGLIGAELAVGVVYGAAGYAVLRYMEWQSRRHATLERA